jgi:type III secretion protein C
MIVRIVFGVAALVTLQPAFAAEPPFSARPVNLMARDQEIAEFLRDFFSAAGQKVIVDPQVKGKVNGKFTGPAAQTWRRLAQAFNLIAYHDGAVTSIYGADKVRSQSVAVPAGRASDLIGNVQRAALNDSHNRVRVAGPDQVLATGVPRYLDQVAQMASNLSATREIAPPGTQHSRVIKTGVNIVQPYELRVFYMRYARADDTTLNAGGRKLHIPGVGSTLSLIMGDGNPVSGGIAAGYSEVPIRQSQPRLGGRGLDAVPPDPSRAAPYDDEYLGLPPTTAMPQVPLLQQSPPRGPRIAIDPSLNAVIVRDRPENMPAYEGLVSALDIRPQIVELEATIIDLNVDRLRELGINWRLRSEGFNAVFGGDIVRRSGIPTTDVTNNGSANRGLSLGGIIGSNQEFIARVNALEEKGAARVVSRPMLVTLSNVEAVFDRTRTFYVRVAGDRQVDLFNITAGTVLRVNPHVMNDGRRVRIRMAIGVEDGAVLDSRVDNIPVVERASVNTQALVNEGEGLLLGGLTVNADYDAESGIPLLKDIPIIGNLFKSTSKRRQRIERLFLITPRLVHIDDALPYDGSLTAPDEGAS